MRQTYTLTLSFLFIWHHKWRFNPTPPNSLIVIWTLTICNPVQFLNQKWILLNILSGWISYFIQKYVSIIGELSIECWFCILDSFSADFIGLILTDNLRIFLSEFVFMCNQWRQRIRKVFCHNVQFRMQAHNPWAAAEYRCIVPFTANNQFSASSKPIQLCSK